MKQGEVWINTQHKNYRSTPTDTVHEVLPSPLRLNEIIDFSKTAMQSYVSLTPWYCLILCTYDIVLFFHLKSFNGTNTSRIKSSFLHLVLRVPHNQAWPGLSSCYCLFKFQTAAPCNKLQCPEHALTGCIVNALCAFLIKPNSLLTLSRPCSLSPS